MFRAYIKSVLLAAMPVLCAGVSAAQGTQAISNNIERAHSVLNDVFSEINYNNTVGDIHMSLRGSYKYPGANGKSTSAREFAMSSDISFSSGGAQLIRKDTFTRIGEDAITSFYDIDDAHVNVKEAGEELKLTDKDRDQYLYQAYIFSPNLLMQVLLQDASRNTFISSDESYFIIRHNNLSGNVFFLYINSKTYFLEKVVMPAYDAESGDHYKTISYSNYDVQDGYQVPGKITITRDSNVIYNLTVHVSEILPRVDYGSTRLSQKSIGDWLYVVPLAKWNSRTVIADMKDFLVIFEPPATVEAGYTLIDNIKRAYPGKEIRYCVVSHHHPEIIGGVRPFMEDGAIIVTTEGNRGFFDNIARNKHMFSKDVRVKKYVTPKFMFVNINKHEIKAGDRVIQFYLLNKKSAHADEYIISYIPSEKILIESDLVKTNNLKERPLDRREKGLVEFIEEQKLSVKQVVQNYPLENTPHIFDYEQIKPESGGKLLQGTKKLLDAIN